MCQNFFFPRFFMWREMRASSEFMPEPTYA
jgi:hypothetical protein